MSALSVWLPAGLSDDKLLETGVMMSRERRVVIVHEDHFNWWARTDLGPGHSAGWCFVRYGLTDGVLLHQS